MEKLRKEMAGRLKEVLFIAKKYGLVTSQQHLGEILGYNDKAYLSSIFNGRVNANDFILNLGEKFPQFNTKWIRTGEGNPINEGYLQTNRNKLLNSYLGTTPEQEDDIFSNTPTAETPISEVEVIDDGTSMEIPFVPPTIIDDPAITIQEYLDDNSTEYEKFDLKELGKFVDIAYRIRTEKLAPHINIGDIIFIKKIQNGQDIHYGDPCIVETSNLGGLLCYVFNDNDNLRLVSNNRTPDIIVPMDKVEGVWKIVGRYTPGISMPDYISNKIITQQGEQISSLLVSVNNLVSATIDEGKRTDKVLEMLEREMEKNAKN